MKKIYTKKGFSIIEIIIGMFIFSLGIISVYALISSSVRLNEYNKNYIIAVNLAREQLELMRNNRDYNYTKIQKYDQINPANNDFSNVFSDGEYYKIQNDFSGGNYPIYFEKIPAGDIDQKENYQLCLENNLYVYCDGTIDENKIPFYKYLYIEKISEDQMKVTSKITWFSKGKHEYEIKTILTDWKQL